MEQRAWDCRTSACEEFIYVSILEAPRNPMISLALPTGFEPVLQP
jgi:hypothetical protein